MHQLLCLRRPLRHCLQREETVDGSHITIMQMDR